VTDWPSQADRARAMRLLFSPGRRLGWVFYDRWLAFHKFPKAPPVPLPVPSYHDGRVLSENIKAARSWARKAVLIGATVGLVASGLGFGLSFPWWALVLIILTPIAMAVVAGRVLRSQATSALKAHKEDQVSVQRSNSRELDAWKEEKDEHEREEWRRVNEFAEWRAQEVRRGPRLDVFGGTPSGWQGLITVFGSSVLGGDHPGPLTLMDLSREGVAEDLTRLARQKGLSPRTWCLPTDLALMDLLAGMSHKQIVDVLVESINHKKKDRDGRMDDAYILSRICDLLGDRVTFGRILAAVQVLMRQHDEGNLLAPEERRRFAEELTDDDRVKFQSHLSRIRSYLFSLHRPGNDLPDDVVPPDTDLLCITTEGNRSSDSEFLDDLLVQWLTNHVNSGAQPPGSTVLVARADDIASEYMEQLSDACRRQRIHLVNLYRGLGENARPAIGNDGSTVAFMRLGNPNDAAAAADFIGRHHRFVVSQVTRTQNTGRSVTQSSKYVPTWLEMFGRSKQLNWSVASSEQRVYEYAVEPVSLQGLPEHALLLVTHAGGDTVVEAVECNPGIVLLPRFTGIPQPGWPAVAEDPAHSAAALTWDATTPDIDIAELPASQEERQATRPDWDW
jgi:hypothetical protein